MYEGKLLREKKNTVRLFTVQFWDDWVSVENAALPVGQISTDVLNLSEDHLVEIRTKLNAFLQLLHTRLYAPGIKKDLALVAAAQDKMNEVWDMLFALPLFRHMNLGRAQEKTMLLAAFEQYPESFTKMMQPQTDENLLFTELLIQLNTIVDDAMTFKTYIGVLLELYFEHLKRRDAEYYAVGVYDFFRDTETLNEIAAALPPHPVFMFRQARGAMIEYVTMPHPEDIKRYVIAERMVFESLGAFLHVDFFRGLMQGNAPRRCHNCGQYFLLTKGYNTCYCNNIAPGETERSCRKVGAHNKQERAEKTPAQKEYAKVYNRLKTRKSRGTISTDEWNRAVALALEYKDKAERGEISELELKRIYGEM